MSIKKELIITFFIIFSLFSCSKEITTSKTGSENEPVSKSELLLGTACRITMYDQQSEHLFDKAFQRIADIEQDMSVHSSTGSIAAVNVSAGLHKPVKISSDSLQVLLEAVDIAQRSGGAFDPTIGPLVNLWGIGTDSAKIPDKESITEAMHLIDYKKIQIDSQENSVYLPEKGMSIDLGGIAKGFAADEVREILKENGVSSAIINLGGNVLTVGAKPDGSAWKIGIQNPESTRGAFIIIVSLVDKAVVTSGVYERFFIEGEKRYHHILDTSTGYPVENNLMSMSIISEDSFLADALSTAAFSLGLEKGLDFIEEFPGIEAIAITSDRNIHVTSGIKEGLIPIQVTDDSFKLSK